MCVMKSLQHVLFAAPQPHIGRGAIDDLDCYVCPLREMGAQVNRSHAPLLDVFHQEVRSEMCSYLKRLPGVFKSGLHSSAPSFLRSSVLAPYQLAQLA